ncbi:MAG TPA: NADH-quinone oxidoreductase subunit J [Armatimonadota bacterium]|nr:NADH-quinone oxidoreductase subunit J [Armatimonadota bacterium]
MRLGIPPPITADWVFWIVAIFILLTALGVVFIKNVIHAALALGACFFGIAAIYILLHAEFLAVAQVLVYVGDITVLILFALMLTRGIVRPYLEKWGAPVAAGVVIAVLLGGMFCRYLTTASSYLAPASKAAPLESLTRYGIVLAFSRQLITDYLLPFEVASGILLMALVGAIVLAREERPDDAG